MRDDDGNGCALLNRRVGPAQFDPWKVEHPPIANCLFRGTPRRLSASEKSAIAIDDEMTRRFCFAAKTNAGIGERDGALLCEKFPDLPA
jgi:hypothetical protein